jgi:hypothetical protein
VSGTYLSLLKEVRSRLVTEGPEECEQPVVCRYEARFVLRLNEISFNGNDAGIEAGSSYKKKLEFPVSTDKPRPELRQR